MSITMSWSLLKLMSIESVMPSNHLVLCHFLLIASIFVSIRWPKYWSFSFSISPSSEYSGLISFRIDCFDPFCYPRDCQVSSPTSVFESINTSVLSLLYGPLSHQYMTPGKTIALTRQSFVGKVMSLLFIF